MEQRMQQRIQLLEQDVQFKDWVVRIDGTLEHADPSYTIDGSNLKEGSWISQMNEKTWIDMNTFMDAYLFALSRAGVDKLEIKIY